MKIELGKEEVSTMVSDWVFNNFVEKELVSCKVDDGTITVEVQDYAPGIHKEDYVQDLGALERAS